MNHCAVRQILNRLCKVARRLALETFPRHHSALRDRVFRPYDFGKEPKVNLYNPAPEVECSAIQQVAMFAHPNAQLPIIDGRSKCALHYRYHCRPAKTTGQRLASIQRAGVGHCQS